MDWVFFIIAVGLIGILVEMVLAHLKEGNKIAEERLHNGQQIQAHQHAIAEDRTNTEKASAEVTQLQAQAKTLKKEIRETKAQLDTSKEIQQRKHPTRHKLEDAQ